MYTQKSMYPEVPPIGGVPDAPPSYNYIAPQHPGAVPMGPTAPTAPMDPMGPMGPMPPMSMPPGQQTFGQQQQPFGQPQPIHVQTAPLPLLGPRPIMVTCPSCHQQQMTHLRYETSTKTHILAALLCFLGCFCCVCIPYCVESCKNCNHYCGNCNAYLGVYK